MTAPQVFEANNAYLAVTDFHAKRVPQFEYETVVVLERTGDIATVRLPDDSVTSAKIHMVTQVEDPGEFFEICESYDPDLPDTNDPFSHTIWAKAKTWICSASDHVD